MTFLDELLPLVEAKMEAEERKARYLDDPVLWAKDMLGVTLWSKQKEILYSIRDNHNNAVAAGHSVGKSYLASVAMAWWADVHPPQDTKILSTAPTFAQVTSILWDNLRKWHIEAKRRHGEYQRRLASGIDLGEYRYNDHALPGYITSGNIWKTELGFEIGIGRKPPDNLLDSAFQGVHAPFLLVIGDEAAGLPEELVRALNNNATGSANRVLLIANPTNPNSAMAKLWKDGGKAKNWVTMNISVFDSPAVTGEDFPYGEADGMSGWDYINEMRDAYGEDDPYYIARVTGQWAFESGMTVFTDEDLAKAMNTVVIPDLDAMPRDGWDIARSEKGDFTVGYRAIEGEVWETNEVGEPVRPTGRRGLRVRFIESWRGAPLTSSNPANLGSANRIDDHALSAGTTVVTIDASGLGAGVVDGLRDLGFGRMRYNVIEYYGSGRTTDTRAFVNQRVEHFFALKGMAFREELDLDPKDEKAIDELRGIVYDYTARGQRKIESKDEIRKRTGGKSPDYADAVIYASFDITPFTENPVGHLTPGDRVAADPYQMLHAELEAADMPW